jgi:hypothetical protein
MNQLMEAWCDTLRGPAVVYEPVSAVVQAEKQRAGWRPDQAVAPPAAHAAATAAGHRAK